jgi:hypothetical protein
LRERVAHGRDDARNSRAQDGFRAGGRLAVVAAGFQRDVQPSPSNSAPLATMQPTIGFGSTCPRPRAANSSARAMCQRSRVEESMCGASDEE